MPELKSSFSSQKNRRTIDCKQIVGCQVKTTNFCPLVLKDRSELIEHGHWPSWMATWEAEVLEIALLMTRAKCGDLGCLWSCRTEPIHGEEPNDLSCSSTWMLARHSAGTKAVELSNSNRTKIQCKALNSPMASSTKKFWITYQRWVIFVSSKLL